MAMIREFHFANSMSSSPEGLHAMQIHHKWASEQDVEATNHVDTMTSRSQTIVLMQWCLHKGTQYVAIALLEWMASRVGERFVWNRDFESLLLLEQA